MWPSLQIASVNTGRAETISQGDKCLTTGICKYPVEGAVHVGEQGLEGDAIVDAKRHDASRLEEFLEAPIAERFRSRIESVLAAIA